MSEEVVPTLTEAELYAAASPEHRTITKTFDTPNGVRKVTLHGDGMTNSSRFFALTEALQRAGNEVGENAIVQRPFTVALPPKEMGRKPEQIVVESPGYLATLYCLEVLSCDPQMSARGWAVFGHKFGPLVIENINDWAMAENGMTTYFAEKVEKIKNAMSAASKLSASTNGSPAHVSTSSHSARRKPSSTSRKSRS